MPSKVCIHLAWLCATACVGTISASAQEAAIVREQQRARIFADYGVTAPTLPSQQYFDELLNPILREKRRIREAREAEAARRAQHNATLKPTAKTTTRFGNTAYDNFSPYPDRKLDARNLSFPMSKEAMRHHEQKINNWKQKRTK